METGPAKLFVAAALLLLAAVQVYVSLDVGPSSSSSSSSFLTATASIGLATTSTSRCTAPQPDAGPRAPTAVVCAFAKWEEAYLDEWVDYNLALGFRSIRVYDNTERRELRQWGAERSNSTDGAVSVAFLPGDKKQSEASRACAVNAIRDGADWAFFADIDEFLVLKKHQHVADFLKEYGSGAKVGAIGINWRLFGDSGRVTYEPFPLSKRFQLRLPANYSMNSYVKSIVKLEAMELDNPKKPVKDPHFFPLKRGYIMKDTAGKKFHYSINQKGPDDVAAVYHYYFKSREEYVRKRVRGGGTLGTVQERVKEAENGLDIKGNPIRPGNVFDDIVWRTLKSRCPRYAAYDTLYRKDGDRRVFD